MPQTLIVIPARMQANRLPGKPLADICGEPMIVHVLRRALESGAGRVIVATDADEVRDAVEQAGGEVVMTRATHESGTDRVHEAVEAIDDQGACDILVNQQGDLPTLDPALIGACIAPLVNAEVDIATLAAEITDAEERTDPHVVKVVGTAPGDGGVLRALYFTRATAPYGDGPLYHHIGLYAFRRAALDRFVA
ncbi:MAG: 3-deoxy-manno-octulosonate cytidylyltransferase, partial [Hyphomicrobiaceae bacterium]|nr:3-deoxy-manno-octulosonate cytidylyltransferase [Hyphomicrobiaceae bacterium]